MADTDRLVPRESGDIDDQAAARELLRVAIGRSSLSARQFATEILVRDERTIRRWLAGDRPIPEVVIGKLRTLLTCESH